MKLTKSFKVSIYFGLTASIIGLLIFSLSWNLWDYFGGPLPGQRIFLLPGNLSLTYFWHPIFTEEINFWPKLFMLLFGQFILVASFVFFMTQLKQVIKKLHNKKINQE
jgi:hypothetical protein